MNSKKPNPNLTSILNKPSLLWLASPKFLQKYTDKAICSNLVTMPGFGWFGDTSSFLVCLCLLGHPFPAILQTTFIIVIFSSHLIFNIQCLVFATYNLLWIWSHFYIFCCFDHSFFSCRLTFCYFVSCLTFVSILTYPENSMPKNLNFMFCIIIVYIIYTTVCTIIFAL